MTREEAIEELERLLRHWDDLENDKRCFWGYDKEAVALALSALRPVSREQVEKVWKSEWIDNGERDANGVPKTFAISCKRCGLSVGTRWMRFCPACGAPMTDEAMQMVMERVEALKDGKDD